MTRNIIANMKLTSQIAAVCPIISVGVGLFGDSSKVAIQFDPAATAPQRQAAQDIVDGFDWSNAALDAWLEAQNPERATVKAQAQQALADIDTYLALVTPSNAQNVAFLRRVGQILKGLIPYVGKLAEG